jgi:hypothetical protein
MQVATVDVSPESANHMIVSLNGVIQKPTDAFTVSGSTITFASALETGDVIDFIQILGNVLDLGVPSDNTVTTAKLADSSVTTAKLNDASVTTAKLNDASVSLAKLTATGTKDATTFLRGDNTFAAPSGGKVLQVLTATDTTTRSSTSTSFVTASNTLSVAITPSAASSKIFVQVSFEALTNSGARGFWTIYKDSTNLGDGNGMASIDQSVDGGSVSMTFLDSPNSTSELTYAVYIKTNATSCSMNANNTKGSIVVMEIGA